MVPINRKKISLYEEAKNGLSSLVWQIATVFVGFIFMLLLTVGNPSSFAITIVFILGIAFVAWHEKNRVTKLWKDSDGSLDVIEKRTRPQKRDKDLHLGIDFKVDNPSSLDLGNLYIKGTDITDAVLRQVSVSSDIKTTLLDLKAVIERENIASTNVISAPTTLFSDLPRQALEQELLFCNQRSQQAQFLLRQAQEQLQLSQLAIQRQEILTQTLQARIDQLELDLQDVHSSGEELRARLKRQQYHTAQLKAALERLLDESSPKDITDKNKADALINLEAIAEISSRSLQLLTAK
ncbi:hypothetical protein ABRG53_0698 [Pseudanabaena sp. ABRG5-3]|nr:hypothetical protein ABRG53_0698 [Pseudanabaena sp. ABRG5-3]